MRLSALVIAVLLALSVLPAQAVDGARVGIGRLSQAMRNTLAPGGEGRQALLRVLYGRLAKARDSEVSQQVNNAIGVVLHWTGSDTAREVIGWADAAMERGELARALDLLDGLIVAMPDLAEGYFRRALVRHEMKDHLQALGDLGRAYMLEPYRHDVLLGLASTYKALGQMIEAHRIYQVLVRMDPQNETITSEAARLRVAVEGQDI